MKFALSTLALVTSFVTGCATTGAGNSQQSTTVSGVNYVDYVAYSAPHGCGLRTRCITLSDTVRSSTNTEIDDLFTRHLDHVRAGQGQLAVSTLDSFFSVLRAACLSSESACRDACERRDEMRWRMRAWNELFTERFPVARDSRGVNQVIRVTWDTDINPTCAAHGNP